MAKQGDIVYVVSIHGSSRDMKFTIYGERETAEQAFREQVASVKRTYFEEENSCPEGYTVDEDYAEDFMLYAIYREGWYAQDNETVSFQKCPILR